MRTIGGKHMSNKTHQKEEKSNSKKGREEKYLNRRV